MSFAKRLGYLFLLLALCGGPSALGQDATSQLIDPQNLNAGLVVAVRVPDGGQVPDLAMDRRGTLHLAYGKGRDAYYAQSRDGGKTFSTPVHLNTRLDTVTVGGERGPKIALGKGGVIQIVWQGHYLKDGGIWVTRSVDGGKTFAPERNVLDTKIGIDEPTLTADDQGNVFVLWLDGRLPEIPDNKVASPLFMARSTDNGATFGKNEPLQTDFPGRGCSCCMLWSRVVGSQLYVAFRTGYRNIRDMYLLHGPKDGNEFQATRVSADNWKYEACPMSGPRFSVPPVYVISSRENSPVEPKRRALIAWMSANHVYWTQSQDGGATFAPRIPAPGSGTDNYPTILHNGRGKILLVWTRNGLTRWAVYEDETLTAKSLPIAQGLAGKSLGRPSAFVRADGTFAVVL